jgi:type IV secretion system protein VirB9|tara:strand:- start:13032 stop:13868 length:837 start_codon:yes stop_codon:yes gene_type:complete
MLNIIFKRFLLLVTLLISSYSFSEEIPVTTDSRIKTLVYNVNEIHQLKFHYGYQSYIEFAENEKIETISIGESFAWRLTPMGQRLFVRPLEVSAHTNMTIITNKRTYHFDIRSGEYDGKIDEELVYVVRFYYPEVLEEVVRTPVTKMANLQPPDNKRVALKPKFEGLPSKRNIYDRVDKEYSEILKGGSQRNFDYKIIGESYDIMPKKVFNDKNRTYLQFKNGNLVIPSIFAVDIFGNERPLNYIIEDDFVVVETVELQFSLRLSNSLLCLFNDNMGK